MNESNKIETTFESFKIPVILLCLTINIVAVPTIFIASISLSEGEADRIKLNLIFTVFLIYLLISSIFILWQCIKYHTTKQY